MTAEKMLIELFKSGFLFIDTNQHTDLHIYTGYIYIPLSAAAGQELEDALIDFAVTHCETVKVSSAVVNEYIKDQKERDDCA